MGFTSLEGERKGNAGVPVLHTGQEGFMDAFYEIASMLGIEGAMTARPIGINTDLEWLMGLADQYAAMTGNAYSEAAHDPSKGAHMAHPERERLEAAMRAVLAGVSPTALQTNPSSGTDDA